MKPKIIEVPLSEYTIKKKPDYFAIGRKVDKVIEKSFPDGKYILRAIGLTDHKGLSLNRLTDIILKTGTDKYDPKRKGVAHDEFSGYDYDIQAGVIQVKDSKLVIPKSYKYQTEFGDIIWHFYEHVLLDRGYAVRIDLLIIYDPRKLVKARKIHPKAQNVSKELSKYLYKFKDPTNKRKALLGVIKILR